MVHLLQHAAIDQSAVKCERQQLVVRSQSIVRNQNAVLQQLRRVARDHRRSAAKSHLLHHAAVKNFGEKFHS